MDVLSEVLKAVKLDGALFYNAEFSAPWCFCSPPSPALAPYLSADSKHVIIFHLLTEGRCDAQVEQDGRPLPLSAGDLVVLPHGDSHALRNGPFTKPVDHAEQVRQVFSQGLKVARMGGGGEIAKFICGYMSCDPQLSRIFLGGLPSILKVNIRADASGQWLEQTIRHSVDSADVSRPGGEALLARLCEVLFIETLRRYIAVLPPEQTGWLAGVRDPVIGKALALLHRRPAHPWTIASLGNEVGISRSVLAERFRLVLSNTPMAYLTRWRLQLGAQSLQSTSNSVAQIAGEVGYESEASFNRAFKREFGLPPARFRSRSKSARRTTDRPTAMSRRRSVKRSRS
ncbi:MAG TPA: AraC family transcriptional regulator [Nitrospira sp.]|nr:AraC family transcriptional regulator [Nitrospira sp.]